LIDKNNNLKLNYLGNNMNNSSFAWVLEVRPGYEEEYKKRHEDIWPGMIQMLKDSGVKKYSIFRHGLTLFGYFETDNLQKTISFINQSKVNAEWGEYMSPIMNIDKDPKLNFPYLLPLQWHME
jgi:L-rhamnose mutarotase